MSDEALLPVDDALDVVLEHARPLGVEEIPLELAVNRYLAEPVVAPLELPPFTNSAMDGFALRHADTPGELEVVGESAAGSPFTGAVGPGQAVTISTGAALPEGADAVAPIEWVSAATTAHRHGTAINVPRSVPHDHSVRH